MRRRPASRTGEPIHRPGTERSSHYMEARAAEPLHLLADVDTTRALEPLERWSPQERPSDTYPSGL